MRGVYEHPKGSGRWWAHYYDAVGKRHRESAGTYDAACTLYHKRKIEAKLYRKLPELGRHLVKFADLLAECRQYCLRHHRRPNTDLDRLDRIGKDWGKRPAAAIQPREIDAWLRSLGLAPATENRYKALMSLSYRLAIEEGKLTVNPARLVRSRRENNVRTRWLTPEEESALFDVIDRRYRRKAGLTRFAMHTGLRRSEQAELTWRDIDWQNRQANVRRAKHGGSRSVPLNDQAMAVLAAIRVRFKSGPPRTVSIFKMAESAEVGTERWISKAAELAGIAPLTWHDLRHTFASRLRMKGVDLAVIKELLGHKTITTTERYAHITPSFHADAVRKLVDFGKE